MPCGSVPVDEGFCGSCMKEGFRGGSQRTPVATRVWSGYPWGYHYEGAEPIRKLKSNRKPPNRFVVPPIPPVPTTFKRKCEGFVDSLASPGMIVPVAMLILLLFYLHRK